MFELKVFQAESAQLIADRYAFFAAHSARPYKGSKPRPFFQALAALTGSGKTPILAQTVMLMRGQFGCEPIVFWMSKAKTVVAQTYANFSPGGKYSDIIDDFRVIPMSQLLPQYIADSSAPLMIMATTGLFNNREQAEGTLNIYKRGNDLFGEQSPWEHLIYRSDNGKRRPLLIVYDESQNLSPQQTDLLAELEPEAYLLASATHKLPDNFNKSVILHIKQWVENDVEDLPALELLKASDEGKPDAQKFITTAISSVKVVKAQLIKKAIQFDGSTAPMEQSLDDLMDRMDILDKEITSRRLSFRPKAIYVCKTNITDDGEKDDHTKPFDHRKAPPIRIWQYLVKEKGVDPKDIAIYANLTFSVGNKDDRVNLFSKGENDFDSFQAGNYQHIIFNLSLQEGWDDPACYLAYIDKSMGSSFQIEQIIGRVLRQYGAAYYDNPLLNCAHFFLRVDNQNVFTETIKDVKAKLQAEGSPIEIIDNYGKGSSGADDLYPRDDFEVKLHHIYVDSDPARERIAEILSEFPTFIEGSVDAMSLAHTASQIVELTELNKDQKDVEWEIKGQTNPVRLRWLVNTAIKTRSSRALLIADLKDPKFDVRVQMQSNAHKQASRLASEIVKVFYQQSELVYESDDPFLFGTLRVSKSGVVFNNGLYERYADFNKFEKPFAYALDKAGDVWHRNPRGGGFYIPLLSEGDTALFFPDFLVWKNNLIYCLDTKGGHLLTDAVARKLFNIQEGNQTKILVRFITEGNQTELRGKVVKGGYTVWKMKSGNPTPIHVTNLDKAVAECLR